MSIENKLRNKLCNDFFLGGCGKNVKLPPLLMDEKICKQPFSILISLRETTID